MVCKEDLCSWFQNLSPHKRIDYLCGMIHICLPLELRFVGSYVEDMAKKDSVHLREHEGKANSREELSKFNEIDAKSFRTKMAIYLALLRSSNRTSSSIIYQLLENHIKQALTVMDNMDEMTVHNILLVLSMAMNHPAFSYHQKIKMYEYYNTANETANQLFSKSQVHREAELLIPSLILSESCDMRVCDERVSPAISPQVTPHPSQHSPAKDNLKVHVTQIEMKGSRQRELDKRTVEYKLQVTWSNGEKKEVFKTYQEIMDFQHKLKEKFPDEQSIHQQDGMVLEISGQNNNRSEITESLTLYTKSLSDLPPHILQCYHFTSFFDPAPQQPVQMTDASTSPRPQNGLALPIVQHNSNGDMHSLSPHSPANCELGYTGPAHSPSCSTKTTSPLISSPSCQSPVSSIDSPSNSHPSSPSLHDTETSSFVNHLRSQHLSMYTDILEGYSIQQLQEMRCEEIESLGLPKEAVLTLKSSLDEKIRLNKLKAPHIPNGIVDPATTGLMYPPPPHAYLPPPNIPNSFPFPHPMHPPFYQFGFPHCPHPVVTGLQEMSPTNSEYSSPSQSPHLPGVSNKPPVNVPVADSSSEDSDRDKQSGQATQSNNWKAPPDTSRPIQPEHVKEEVNRQDSYSNSGTPPLNCDQPALSTKTGYHGNSGYTSDPTYNAPRPQLMRPPYHKAIPAHINLSVPPKYIINMPENHFKGGPMAIPQHLRDITMTTGANLHGYSMFTPDAGPRPMYPMMNGHPHAILNRSHMNYVPKSVIQSGLLAQSVPQAGSPINVSCNNNAGKLHPGNPGPVLPVPPPVTLSSTQTVQHTNSVENVNTSDVPCGHSQSHINNDTSSNLRISVIPRSSTPTSTPATQPVPGQSLSNNHCVQMSRSSCTSCGCPGHSSAPTPSLNYMPQMPQNIWPAFTNGLIPIQTMYMPHAQYLNGVNQEQVYNHHAYGLVNHANSRMAGNVPNHVYGLNCHNSNHIPTNNSNSGYSKRVKKIFCSNCGSNKHMAVDCTETTMEALSGHIRYSYKNDSD